MFDYQASGELIAFYIVSGEIFTKAPQTQDMAIVLVDTGENQAQRYCVAHCESGSLDRYSGRYFDCIRKATGYFSTRIAGLTVAVDKTRDIE